MRLYVLIFCFFRVNITYIDRQGDRHNIKGKVGDNVLYLAHRHEIELEGIVNRNELFVKAQVSYTLPTAPAACL